MPSVKLKLILASQARSINEYKNLRSKVWRDVQFNVYWTMHHCNSWRIKDQLDVTCYFISLLMYSTQHVSDINISIIRGLRLCCWITTSVVLFSVRCVLEIWCGWVWVVPVLQASAAPNLQHTTNWEQNDRCGNSTT